MPRAAFKIMTWPAYRYDNKKPPSTNTMARRTLKSTLKTTLKTTPSNSSYIISAK